MRYLTIQVIFQLKNQVRSHTYWPLMTLRKRMRNLEELNAYHCAQFKETEPRFQILLE